MAKKKSNKSGQSTGERYSSNLIHHNRLPFLVPVIGDLERRETLKRINLKEDRNQRYIRTQKEDACGQKTQFIAKM